MLISIGSNHLTNPPVASTIKVVFEDPSLHLLTGHRTLARKHRFRPDMHDVVGHRSSIREIRRTNKQARHLRCDYLIISAIPRLVKIVLRVEMLLFQERQIQYPPTVHQLAIFIRDVGRWTRAIGRVVVVHRQRDLLPWLPLRRVRARQRESPAKRFHPQKRSGDRRDRAIGRPSFVRAGYHNTGRGGSKNRNLFSAIPARPTLAGILIGDIS